LYLRIPQTNYQHEVLPGREVTVGRAPTCDVDLSKHLEGYLKAISRQHFKVFYAQGEGFAIVDMSHNGTQVNNIPLTSGEQHILRNGDVIKLANNYNFTIEALIDDDPEVTDTITDPDTLTSAAVDQTQSALYFDASTAQFVINEHPIPHEHLTKLEVDLLKYLCNNEGRLCTFDAISNQVWGDPGWVPENNTISRAVGNLRKKLDQVSPGAGDYIQNIRGQGYKVDSKILQ